MPFFPDFASTARLGFQTGMQMGEGQNPLGTFIRTMLADWQQRRAVETEVGLKVAGERGIAKYKQILEEESELGKAKTGISKIQLGVMQEAKRRYDEGDRSPEVLKALDMYATPNIFNLISGLGENVETMLPPLPSSTETFYDKPPKYNPATHTLQYNKKLKKYRLIAK